MLLEKLENGSLVNLELVTEEEKCEVTSLIAGAGKNSLLIEPVTENAHFEHLKHSKHVVFNLYADDAEGNRVGWYNVAVKLISYKDHEYSGVFTRGYNQESAQTDRRDSDRLKVKDMTVRVETGDGEQYEVTLYDLSNHGIAFVSDENDFLNKRLIIHLSDSVDGEVLTLNIPCRCVRTNAEQGRKLFGCSIPEPDRRFLTYLFEKRLALRMSEQTCAG